MKAALQTGLLACATMGALALAAIPFDDAAAYGTTGSKFASSSTTYRINPNFSDASAGDANAQVEAIRAGADEWRATGQGNFNFSYAGETAVSTIAADGVNAVYYSHTDGNGPLAVCYWWTLGGVTTNFDIVFFDRMPGWDFVWARTPTASQFDIQGVAAHELGHALGLDHSSISGATMYATTTVGTTTSRSLHSDDCAGMQFLYGNAGPLTPTVVQLAANHGYVDGGTAVTVVGSGFPSSGASVKFNGNSASSVVWVSPSKLTCTAPPSSVAGAVNVSVSVGAQTGTLAQGYIYDHCKFVNTPQQGSWNWVQCRAPGDGGKPYLAMLSFTAGSIPVSSFGSASDPRIIGLGYDEILYTAVMYGAQLPQWLNNPVGFLNGAAAATFGFYLPPQPSLAGLSVRVGFLTGDASAPSGIGTVSGIISSTL
jgi:hypothetical protein